jgi:hypothetical protein
MDVWPMARTIPRSKRFNKPVLGIFDLLLFGYPTHVVLLSIGGGSRA